MAGHGANPLIGHDMWIENVEYTTYGPNVEYPAIPFEMIRTAHTSPQVTVKIDGMPALCTGLACDYTVETPTGLITGFSVSGLDVSITGTNLPTEPPSVRLANTDCAITSHDESMIQCTLVTPWVGGEWLPAVRDAKGRIPVSSSVATHKVPVLVNSFNPAVINVAGGDKMTVYGEGFPSDLSAHPGFELTWEEDGTKCIVYESTATEVKCVNRKFSRQLQSDVIAELEANGGRRALFSTFSLSMIASLIWPSSFSSAISAGIDTGGFGPPPLVTTFPPPPRTPPPPAVEPVPGAVGGTNDGGTGTTTSSPTCAGGEPEAFGYVKDIGPYHCLGPLDDDKRLDITFFESVLLPNTPIDQRSRDFLVYLVNSTDASIAAGAGP